METKYKILTPLYGQLETGQIVELAALRGADVVDLTQVGAIEPGELSEPDEAGKQTWTPMQIDGVQYLVEGESWRPLTAQELEDGVELKGDADGGDEKPLEDEADKREGGGEDANKQAETGGEGEGEKNPVDTVGPGAEQTPKPRLRKPAADK